MLAVHRASLGTGSRFTGARKSGLRRVSWRCRCRLESSERQPGIVSVTSGPCGSGESRVTAQAAPPTRFIRFAHHAANRSPSPDCPVSRRPTASRRRCGCGRSDCSRCDQR